MEDKLEKFLSDVRLIVQKDLEDGEAFASVVLNPNLRWMKFILTDDKPNENKQRVPQEEFPNLIQTGIHMPIKMADGEIADGHEESFPIGVITNLKQIKNRIEGLAALWSRERPEDIDHIIKEFETGTIPQISYEIPFTSSVTTDEGIEDLAGTCLGAATLVGIPAYAGRTPVLAVASKNKDGTDDNTMEETKSMEELETLKQQLTEAQDKIKELEDKLTGTKETEASLNKELTELREYKADIDKLAEENDKLDKIEAKFTEAGIERAEDYFVKNKEMLLTLDDAAIDFMTQEMVSFAEKRKGAEADLKDDDAIPPITGDKNTVPTDVKELADALREHIKK